MLPIPVPKGFRIIAHRGASAYTPENTMAAFGLAEEMGIYEVELDTQLSADGVIVLCHDLTLERYGHGTGVVEETSSTNLLSLDMGSWFSPHLYRGEPMPTLDRLFEHFGDRLFYHVELKGQKRDLPDRVLDTIAQHDLEDSCIITSFSYDHLVRTSELSSQARLGWLVDEIDAQTLEKGRALPTFQLCPRAKTITVETVQRVRTAADEIRAWGMHGSSLEVVGLINKVIEAGCDGMTINWPDWVAHI